MKRMLFAGLCMAALATSCSDNLGGTEGTQSVQLDATVSAENTRAAFLENGNFYWQSGDKIGVITSTKDGSSTKFTSLTLKTGGGQNSATFEGTISGSLGSYAIYPYDENQEVKDNTLSYTFPSSYEYSKVDQTFFPTNQDGNSFNPAMLASISNGKVAFKHLGGVFCINVESMPCASGTLTLTTDQSLCGKYTTTVGSGTPELKSSSEATTGNKTVSIKFTGAEKNKPGVFYIPVPTGTYTNATITFTADNKEALKVVGGTYKVERTYLKKLDLKTVTIDAETVSEQSSVEAAQTALATSNNVVLSSEINTATITVPAITTTTGTKAKTLTLQKVADNANITVSDANTSTASKSVKELTVSIPNTENTEQAPTLTVTMPNSTVTLAGNAGTATFKKVTASTAVNTLVITEGVTIDELEIVKGNVRINKGATVKKIILASGCSAADVYYETGASVPSEAVTGITMYEIGVGVNPITTETQFEAAVTKGGEYTLLKDLTLSADYSQIASTVSIDLNQKTLKAWNIYSVGGDVTLKNGNINQTGGVAILAAGSNGKLTLDGIKYTGEKANNCVFVIQCSQKASLTVKNSTIKGGYYGVTTNASTKPTIAKECTIDLENCTIDAVESGTMLNIPATVTIKNCKFSGNHQGAFFRGGNYTIENCEFTLKAELAFRHGDDNWMQAWKSGNCGAFAALTIGNYKNSAYAYETKATFTGTNKAIVSGTYASSYPAIHVCSANNYAVTITGFKNNMTTEGGKTQAIEYGTDNITVDGNAKTANVTAN